MFARTVTIQLKPNTLTNFNQTFETEVLPMLRKQAGFRDVITLADENGTDLTAISLWETRGQADNYATTTYPAVLNVLDQYFDGLPKVRVANVVNSTSHKLTAAAVAA